MINIVETSQLDFGIRGFIPVEYLYKIKVPGA